MVHASVHMEYDSMHGWAIGHRSTNLDLPPPQLPSNHHLHPISSCLPYQNLGNGDLQDGSLVSLGETLCHVPQENQEIHDSCEKLSSQKQKQWSNHPNLPVLGTLQRLQGWLLHGDFSPTLLWSTHMGSFLSGSTKRGNAPIRILTSQI